VPRAGLYAALAVGLLVAGCNALKVAGPVQPGEDDWLTEGESPQRRHVARVEMEPPLEEAWVYNAGAAFGNGSPLLFNDAVLVATLKGEVHAINFETGKKIGTTGFGDAISGTPVVEDGWLYVPLAWGRKVLKGYDLRNGRERWTVRSVPIEAGLLAMDDLLFAVDVEGSLRAFDRRDGTERWVRQIDSTAAIHATPLAVGSSVFIADEKGQARLLSAADGGALWSRDLGTPVFNTPTTDGRTIFVPSTRGRLTALDAERGDVRWTYSIADTTVRFAAPALADQTLYLAGTDGFLRALDAATGEVRWTFDADEALTSAPLITAGSLYFGTMDRKLFALSLETGEFQWEVTLKGRVKSAMAARDGGLIVLTEPRYVYRFRQAPPATSYAESE
jgi:outer membrane protein assembly factor BamB